MQEMQETWIRSLSQEDPLEEEVATPLVFLPRESHGQRSLAGATVHRVAKSWTRLKGLGMRARTSPA